MDNNEVLNALQTLNTQVDDLSQRVNTLETNAPQKGEYFQVLLDTLKKTECCNTDIQYYCECDDTSTPVHTIVCAGSANTFIARQDGNDRTFEVQINDSTTWVDIFNAPNLIAEMYPTPPGYLFKLSSSSSEYMRVRLRTSSPIGLYVNHSLGINEIEQENQAYTLLDAQGNVIDPTVFENQSYNSYDFDDEENEEDFGVLFQYADFCLSPFRPPAEIPIYHPYAVFNTTAAWGTEMPCILTINDDVYNGVLYGQIADILAHNYNIYVGFNRIYDESINPTDMMQVTFAGSPNTANYDISVDFQFEVELTEVPELDWSFRNDNLVLYGPKATFKLGKLNCPSGIEQNLRFTVSNGYLIYQNTYELNLNTYIDDISYLEPKVAGFGIEDPTSQCSTAISPAGCVDMTLYANLASQWNPAVKSLGLNIDYVYGSLCIKPLLARPSVVPEYADDQAVMPFVARPSNTLPLESMDFLGYALPFCVVAT